MTGDHVVNKKPHPEIYLKAADSIGLDPAQCVVIEDAVTGVASAKAAGMKCVAVDTRRFFRQDCRINRIVGSGKILLVL